MLLRDGQVVQNRSPYIREDLIAVGCLLFVAGVGGVRSFVLLAPPSEVAFTF